MLGYPTFIMTVNGYIVVFSKALVISLVKYIYPHGGTPHISRSPIYLNTPDRGRDNSRGPSKVEKLEVNDKKLNSGRQ